jgi:hypothetical protein
LPLSLKKRWFVFSGCGRRTQQFQNRLGLYGFPDLNVQLCMGSRVSGRDPRPPKMEGYVHTYGGIRKREELKMEGAPHDAFFSNAEGI